MKDKLKAIREALVICELDWFTLPEYLQAAFDALAELEAMPHPYIEVVLEDGTMRVHKNVGDVDYNLIDLDDGGILEDE